MTGATGRSEKEIAERALELAEKHGAAGVELDVVHVDPKVLEDRGRFKVHLKSRTLVALKSTKKKSKKSKR
jgi:hypothetical protein